MQAQTKPRRVTLYGRVSIERDGERSKSVDDQLAELREWARASRWQVVAEHRDDGISASRFAHGRARHGWQSAMDDIVGRRVDAILVWEISRASRDRAVNAALFAACAEADVKIGTGGKLHDPNDPDDGFMLDLGGALAVRESSMTSKRTRRASASRAAQGKPNGSVPYGYRRVIDPDTGKTTGRTTHPDQAPIVAEIARRLLTREPADAIAADLNRRGIPTATGDRWLGRHLPSVVRAMPEHPVSIEIAQRLNAGELPRLIAGDLNAREVPKPIDGGWRGGNLRILAVRPTYAGLRVHRGEVLDGVTATWPPIITEAEHHALVAMFAAPERDKFRNPTHVKHLGTGLFRCGRDGCLGTMRVVVQHPRPSRYDCKTCHKISRYQAPVDELVEKVAIARLSQPDAIAALADSDDAAASEAAQEAARLRAKIADARAAWADDRLSLESFTAMEAATLPKIADAERRARPVALPAALVEMAGPDAARKWAAATISTRRAVLDTLMTVTLLPIGRGGRPFEPESVAITWKGAQ